MNRVIRMTLLLIFRPKRLKNNIYFALNSHTCAHTHNHWTFIVIDFHLYHSIVSQRFFSLRKFATLRVWRFESVFPSVLGPADNKPEIICIRKAKLWSSFSFVQYLIVIVKCEESIKEFRYFGRKDETPQSNVYISLSIILSSECWIVFFSIKPFCRSTFKSVHAQLTNSLEIHY